MTQWGINHLYLFCSKTPAFVEELDRLTDLKKCTESCFIQIGVKVRRSGKMKESRKEGNWSDSLRKTANKTKEDIKRTRME